MLSSWQRPVAGNAWQLGTLCITHTHFPRTVGWWGWRPKAGMHLWLCKSNRLFLFCFPLLFLACEWTLISKAYLSNVAAFLYMVLPFPCFSSHVFTVFVFICPLMCIVFSISSSIFRCFSLFSCHYFHCISDLSLLASLSACMLTLQTLQVSIFHFSKSIWSKRTRIRT